MTTYLYSKWINAPKDQPKEFYSELDAERYETRKVEVFSDDKLNYASATKSTCETRLGEIPVPPTNEITDDPEFDTKEISKEAFEEIWEKANDNFYSDPVRKRKVIKSLPFLKGRKKRSFEKAADSFMAIANLLFSSVIVSAVATPMSVIVKNIFSDSPKISIFDIEQLQAAIVENGPILITMCGVAVFLAWHFRKIALNIYDLLDS
ncbi:DUF6881 domain-containing protein [Marinomonas spartinae]|uniref:DUF6881 domain-containing protein n=1 Tax=Marinomonas spartinae TaxID=1792290 RepID=UPI0018F219DC|nr:hypothetical protein [Marinomonas spartinae]MBJ7553139.1 hypothetical protein [Marinomonas spartinae]